MIAVIETGGKQYKIEEGLILDIEKIEAANKKEVAFDKVLLIKNKDTVLIGQPYIDKAVVMAEILEDYKDKKVIVFKFKKKTGYKKTKGHRQHLTRIKINKIKLPTEKKEVKKEKNTRESK
ncbi:50S ribosomal protein L21 [bacterium]|jgi:large subunit ribosomal protein L21|nr:50S ribosomal protein L21 [bacterium]MBT3580845.1 50S ribosomal protein L21 [bacterium]MBT4552411.1 50S ribosomal protein L21 [bacterium]MBT5989081.1 50S ribosomal protein L21 [bacterium]MBT7088050.1 50S ribosomal protein L21 [bacterium]